MNAISTLYKIKHWISRLLLPLPYLHRPLRRLWQRCRPKGPTLIDQLQAATRQLPTVHFVQVGSNDGAQGDPLHQLIRNDPRWRGLFIEPVGFLFERLRGNYSEDPRFAFANVAIAAKAGNTAFYYVSDLAKHALGDRLPYWYDQLGSFDREHIVKHLDNLVEPYIVEQHLPCLPLQAVLDQHGVHQIDVLHVDTEGYDSQILLMVDFARYQPRAILYEHRHLSPKDRQSTRALLEHQGYRLRQGSDDTLAIRH